jgi:hypothetical protein
MLSLLVSFQLHAEDQAPLEAPWKGKLRSLISRIAGEEWSSKLLGSLPKPEEPKLVLPEIPAQFKKSTDASTYIKQTKGVTEFDKLPAERKKQFHYKFLDELFQVTRKTPPKDEDIANWLNTLDQGGSREGIYQALTLDEVYNGLESIPDRPSQRLLEFCLKYSQSFLKQTFKTDSLTQLNLYSLKRIFTEKGLDLMEYYEGKNLEYLYRWYALHSAFLAKEYGPMLGSDIRKNESAEFHYQWALSMPIQHIKSEFIIKMHSVMNQLQLLNQS